MLFLLYKKFFNVIISIPWLKYISIRLVRQFPAIEIKLLSWRQHVDIMTTLQSPILTPRAQVIYQYLIEQIYGKKGND